MFFNSINFAIFLPLVFVLYWFGTKGNLKLQNILLLVSSYFFYACWDYRFLFLLIFSTLVCYFTGIRIHSASTKFYKKTWLWISVAINIGFLGFFKYFNFFIESFSEGLSLLGIQSNYTTLQIILPVGISFYTFHGLSYIIDLYNDRIKPENNFINYSVFVSFFPLLVAGPIERATHLLPQILKNREFNYEKVVNGLRQILWGLFKKIVVADNCAEIANMIFNDSAHYSGSTLALGAIFFAFQIYCDFSGYSDIAIGTAKLLGIDLLRNFAFPYFSRDIAEFWRRWHISLSSWFRDYVYIPLGGSKVNMLIKIRNTLIIFLISGFWHGANWTFIMWGFLNALYIIPSIIFKTNRNNLDIVAKDSLLPSIKETLSIILTFSLTVFAWIFFRADSMTHAFEYISGIFSSSFFTFPTIVTKPMNYIVPIFIVIEWIGRKQQFAIETIGITWKRPFRWLIYYCIIAAIFYYGGKEQVFIYFQF